MSECVQLHSCLCVSVYVCVYMCYFCLSEDNKEKCKSVVKRMCDGGTGHVNVVVRWLVCMSVSVHVCVCTPVIACEYHVHTTVNVSVWNVSVCVCVCVYACGCV